MTAPLSGRPTTLRHTDPAVEDVERVVGEIVDPRKGEVNKTLSFRSRVGETAALSVVLTPSLPKKDAEAGERGARSVFGRSCVSLNSEGGPE
jgi:hypothetical protein